MPGRSTEEFGEFGGGPCFRCLAEIGARPSIGTIGDSYDNALAESMNGLYESELIRRRGPWRNAEHLEIETLAYIEWFNHRRLHGELDPF